MNTKATKNIMMKKGFQFLTTIKGNKLESISDYLENSDNKFMVFKNISSPNYVLISTKENALGIEVIVTRPCKRQGRKRGIVMRRTIGDNGQYICKHLVVQSVNNLKLYQF